MRLTPLFILLFLATVTTSAFAGSVTYADMRGAWQSTQCTAPQAFILAAKGSEARANDLNAQIAERNKYIAEAHDYMLCISQEAQRDSDATGILVTQSAKALLDKTQSEIDAAMIGPQPRMPAK
ncbi:MAG: hypothetical protein PHD48_01810 [Alphaproteobacteria bacterium]|nr:hypothetical protein [Alphaproteobacteria bacterium]